VNVDETVSDYYLSGYLKILSDPDKKDYKDYLDKLYRKHIIS